MKPIVAVAVVFLFFAAFNCPLHPQKVNLAELQKKEKERRKKAKKSKYVITNDNIDKIEVPEKPYSFIKMGDGKNKGKKSSSAASKKPAVKPGKSTDMSGAEEGAPKVKMTKEYWQQRKIELLLQISNLKNKLDKWQLELNRAANIYPDETLDQQIERKQAAQKLRVQMKEGKEQLKKLDRDLNNLEENARKMGVPPGWLRVDPNDFESGKSKKKGAKSGSDN